MAGPVSVGWAVTDVLRAVRDTAVARELAFQSYGLSSTTLLACWLLVISSSQRL